MFRSTRSLHLPTRELPLSPDTTMVLHQVYNLLLSLLGRAKLYVDASVHGTTKLVQYFSFMTYCLISKTEKLMFTEYFMDLWNLFQVGLAACVVLLYRGSSELIQSCPSSPLAQAVGARHRHQPQQAGTADLLVQHVCGLSRECAPGGSEPRGDQEHRLQLHPGRP